MRSRKMMFEKWKENYPHVMSDRPVIFIDGRMESESFQVYAVTPDMADRYEATLFSDEEVPDAPCSLKATSHIAAHATAMMMEMFNNHLTNIRTEDNCRDIPFSNIWNSAIAYLEQEY